MQTPLHRDIVYRMFPSLLRYLNINRLKISIRNIKLDTGVKWFLVLNLRRVSCVEELTISLKFTRIEIIHPEGVNIVDHTHGFRVSNMKREKHNVKRSHQTWSHESNCQTHSN